MSDSTQQAFFLGRALATAVSEQLERALTEGISAVGRFDAEQRESLRQFTEAVFVQAQQAAAATPTAATAAENGAAPSTEDLQATIDTLRAEIAQVRVAVQQYRNTSDTA
ncbi:MAG: DUF6825 family protein [Cyanobacteria bacterium P01_A01_bin.105]